MATIRMKPVWSYAGAVAAVVVASLGTAAIQPWMGPSVSILFFPAVIVPAMYGGYGPALLATVLSTISLAYYFVVPATPLCSVLTTSSASPRSSPLPAPPPGRARRGGRPEERNG